MHFYLKDIHSVISIAVLFIRKEPRNNPENGFFKMYIYINGVLLSSIKHFLTFVELIDTPTKVFIWGLDLLSMLMCNI